MPVDYFIELMLSCSCAALVGFVLVLNIINEIVRIIELPKTRPGHLILKQILEDVFWDEWIEAEAHRINLIFEKEKNIVYRISTPRDYLVYHPSGKYRGQQIADFVINRFEDLKEGAGRNLILS